MGIAASRHCLAACPMRQFRCCRDTAVSVGRGREAPGAAASGYGRGSPRLLYSGGRFLFLYILVFSERGAVSRSKIGTKRWYKLQSPRKDRILVSIIS